jgi:hypothetical protein
LEEEALNLILWRTGFGRGYGYVVKTQELMNSSYHDTFTPGVHGFYADISLI